MDNDIFMANDSGYSNGFYFSWIEVGSGDELLQPGMLNTPLSLLLAESTPLATVVTGTIGQAIITPEDITVEDPGDNQVPYSGLLFYNSSYVEIHEDYADRTSTSIGVIGPASGAEYMQKFVHEITGSDEPLGWDTQLQDELVFRFSGGRTWRSWISADNNYDLLTSVEAGLGTISSNLLGGLIFRYGNGLRESYASHLLGSSKTTNPIATKTGWYTYVDIKVGYTFNQIFTDGNTYRDSRSIDYEKKTIGLGFGFAYAWQNLSLTFAINDANLKQGRSNGNLRELTQYGTLTFAWKY